MPYPELSVCFFGQISHEAIKSVYYSGIRSWRKRLVRFVVCTLTEIMSMERRSPIINREH